MRRGNFAAGVPSLTTALRGVVEVVVTVRTLSSAMHSGVFGGAAPDALAALIVMLATLRDERGRTTIHGLDNTQTWTGAKYQPEQFRKDANVLDGVDLLGDDISDMIWARPAVTVLGIDCPPIDGCTAAIQPEARALISLRIPPGVDARTPRTRSIDHLAAVAPWHVQVDFERAFEGQPFAATVDGPAFAAMAESMREVYGREVVAAGRRRFDPAVQRPPGDISRCRDHAARRRGAAVPDPRAQRERRSPRDREHGAGRGAVPAEVRLSRDG